MSDPIQLKLRDPESINAYYDGVQAGIRMNAEFVESERELAYVVEGWRQAALAAVPPLTGMNPLRKVSEDEDVKPSDADDGGNSDDD